MLIIHTTRFLVLSGKNLVADDIVADIVGWTDDIVALLLQDLRRYR